MADQMNHMAKIELPQQAETSQPDFEGKVAIVTGAASGIGRAAARPD
jgi:NADP-dependent 3-hydroxy acid dehydrogenase YdfG